MSELRGNNEWVGGGAVYNMMYTVLCTRIMEGEKRGLPMDFYTVC